MESRKRGATAANPGCRVLCAGLLIACAVGVRSAGAVTTHYEFWPELDIWVKLTDATRLLLTGAGTRDRDSGERTDGEGAIYLDYRMSERISWRVGYAYERKLADAPGESDSIEHRFMFDFTYHWHPWERAALTDRTRLERRELDSGTSYRVRNRLRVEQELEFFRHVVTPYASLEAYYDDRYGGVSRVRAEAGATTSLGELFVLDLYFGRQHDSRPQEVAVNGLGLTLNCYF